MRYGFGDEAYCFKTLHVGDAVMISPDSRLHVCLSLHPMKKSPTQSYAFPKLIVDAACVVYVRNLYDILQPLYL
ncbi:hypothetical protein ANAPC1_01267 [Anaplasma phagocytophilum]|uniref:Uncharacterized protein n=1 Tax=Anaplasma phagocytophilum TaxID=948 RepID=A0AA45ZI74_ANAPH|nr:hypothetical protein ANAPC1_01267 [Anaplasma phagocytophilum]SBO32459.1 hypothetical protein ANAPC2_01035 [Anaplasma phagocytophilum]SBO32856.1 hypothetical protein ANAPC3_01015 [Anaplasma phagocytophilum]SBO33003.1 hypothetical protein ANAPC4_01000 [Anaplasma phagocytophilum]SCV64406.1 hypothetical protein ANAPC5_00855 [Anaplasma phagocytophilum]